MMTFVSPTAAGVGLAGDPALEVGAALDAAALELAAPDDEALDAFSSLEQPATPTTTVAALTTINNPRFTDFSFRQVFHTAVSAEAAKQYLCSSDCRTDV
jgi:hypothetical protein